MHSWYTASVNKRHLILFRTDLISGSKHKCCIEEEEATRIFISNLLIALILQVENNQCLFPQSFDSTSLFLLNLVFLGAGTVV